MFFPTDEFGKCVVLAKLFYCDSFCAPVFVCFSVWFSLEKPARQTSFFIKIFFRHWFRFSGGKIFFIKNEVSKILTFWTSTDDIFEAARHTCRKQLNLIERLFAEEMVLSHNKSNSDKSNIVYRTNTTYQRANLK